jgi:ketosteroid isomerase-like protein
MDAKADVLRLDNAWNEAYRRHSREQLENVLADDFLALTPAGDPITKALLLVNPSETASLLAFSEQDAQVFGDTAVTRGRLQLELEDRRIDQRFLRVFARRNGMWRAVSVAVTPVLDEWQQSVAVDYLKPTLVGLASWRIRRQAIVNALYVLGERQLTAGEGLAYAEHASSGGTRSGLDAWYRGQRSFGSRIQAKV